MYHYVLISSLLLLPQLNGQNLTAELWRELETLEKIEHRNLARLFGFFERTADILIVVEYVSNGSLREHLEGMQCCYGSSYSLC